MQKRTHRRARGGFTLIEVLLVLAILGVIAAMVVPQLIGTQKAANIKATKNSIASLEGTLEIYAVGHNGEYPTTADGFSVLISQPANDMSWNGPYIKDTKKLPTDAWGQPFTYEYPGQHNTNKPDISSAGPDKTPGTQDDITNWSA